MKRLLLLGLLGFLWIGCNQDLRYPQGYLVSFIFPDGIVITGVYEDATPHGYAGRLLLGRSNEPDFWIYNGNYIISEIKDKDTWEVALKVDMDYTASELILEHERRKLP